MIPNDDPAGADLSAGRGEGAGGRDGGVGMGEERPGRTGPGRKALVFGATGFTGREVVRQLRERGDEVVAHVRPGSRAADRWGAAFEGWGARVVRVPWEPDALGRLLRDEAPDTVYLLLGTTKRRAREEGLGGDIYDRIDRALTELAVEAAKRAGLAPLLVYLSSVGADPRSKNAYVAARGKVEQTLAGSGLPWVVARPSFIHGPGRDRSRLGEAVGAAVGNGVLRVAGWLGAARLRDRYRSIDNVGLARALIRAASDDAQRGRVLHGEDLQRLVAR